MILPVGPSQAAGERRVELRKGACYTGRARREKRRRFTAVICIEDIPEELSPGGMSAVAGAASHWGSAKFTNSPEEVLVIGPTM